jgi:poly-beta-1,6-N-acetyl-D-glucosamine synthase
VTERLRLLVIVPFRDEAEHMPTFLASMAAQLPAPHRLVLVDDGSTDGSTQLAARYAAERPYARVARRPPRGPERDRLATAQAWRAFCWGLEHAGAEWDVVAKLDADLRLSPGLFGQVERRFRAEPGLGMAGVYLSQLGPDGRLHRQPCPPGHVEGPTKFYRRSCLEQISPIPAIVGWDTIDETRARMRGWRTAAIELPAGDPVHLRRMGSHDGVLRGYRRAGWAAYAYGAHPLYLLAAATVRLRHRPAIACGAAYLGGYAAAALRREARAEPEVRARQHREQRKRLAALLRRRAA